MGGVRAAGRHAPGLVSNVAATSRFSSCISASHREALKAALQYPGIAGTVFDSLPVECFTEPAYAAVRQAMTALGGTSSGLGGAGWVDAVRTAVDDRVDVEALLACLDHVLDHAAA